MVIVIVLYQSVSMWRVLCSASISTSALIAPTAAAIASATANGHAARAALVPTAFLSKEEFGRII